MDTLPKLPMLLFELKSVHCGTEFGPVLRKKIRECYEEDPSSFSKEIKEIETLRNKAAKISRDVNGCSLLKHYYSQLCMLQNRFKGLKESDLEFSWIDIYKGNVVTGNIELELDAIMYNIGALHGELGAIDIRSRAESMKVACTHFQCAAWAFEQLKENSSGFKSKDISRDIVSFIYQIMLAQAQECILEKSILDNRKASIIAKVAAQVIEYCNSALLVLLQAAANTEAESIVDIVGSRLYKEWKKFIEFKISYYSAICSFYMGNFCEEQQKMGERVAWYISADEKLCDASKQAKSIDRSEVDDALKFLSEMITSKLNTAKKENDFVYHESVPTSDKLTAVKGASLVKGIGFSVSDKDVSGNDIFIRLVPIEAHELASVYSEKKDNIIRDISSRVQDKNEDLAAFMSSLQLDRDTLRPSSSPFVPDELIEICAAMSVKQNILSETKVSFRKLEELCNDVEKNIKEARKLISDEEQKEKEHQERFGKRAPSMIIMELSKELAKHEETHKRAMQSNENLKISLEHNSDDINLLCTCSAKELDNLLPQVSKVPFDEQNLQQIDKLLAKVDEMKEQRFTLEEQLRSMIQKDDIIKKILSHPKDEIKDVFGLELKKYDNHIHLLNQNLEAQENILNALTKENAKYVKTRKALLDNEKNRQSRIEQLINSYETFHQVISNIEKGNEFYSKFDTIVARLLARVRSVTRVQEEERMQFVDVHTRKNRFNQTQPTNTALISQISSAPKLKDFLPYMNTSKTQPSVTRTIQTNEVYTADTQNIAYIATPGNESNIYHSSTFNEASSNSTAPIGNVYYSQPQSVTSLDSKPLHSAQSTDYGCNFQQQSHFAQQGYQNYYNPAMYAEQYTVSGQQYNYAGNNYNQAASVVQQVSDQASQEQVATSAYFPQSTNNAYDYSNAMYTQNTNPASGPTMSYVSSLYSAKPENNNYGARYETMYSTIQPTNNTSYSHNYVTSDMHNTVSVTPTTVTEQNGHSNAGNKVEMQQETVPGVDCSPVQIKTTSDPNNLLSQFDPLWS
ncbi:tyrosine-protein phosphatase non-receptor-like protein 2 [Leptotrombidium deliense]|uniref:Tyrosine-protein phosphatase non-receptor-like protein 2 n=1 Tax=Leptotrombidium deliense TaxID=299467 RepID=A0A443STV7_9ACAR|nr:tyrosine-protein phosphatase non-receptor-like protein 2 [Leptotrombidium deliense]